MADEALLATLCKVCLWWDHLDEQSTLDGDAAHDLANIVMEIRGHRMADGTPCTCPLRKDKQDE